MDMSYFLKDKLCCQDCKHDLKYVEDDGYMKWIAVCIVCDREYEIELEIKLK